MATYLAEQVHLCRGFVAQGALGPPWLATQPAGLLWPRPHNGRFDFAASAPGAEWIDELATAARDRLSEAAGEVVVAHSDWRTEHVRSSAARSSRPTTGKSLAVGTEPALIGQIGHTFTVDLGMVLIWNLPEADIAQDSFTGLLGRRGAQLLG